MSEAQKPAKLHLRKMIPPEPEMVAEEEIAYTQLHEQKGKEIAALSEWVHWDPATGKMLKTGKPPKAAELRPTGGMLAVDVLCKDCGAHLQAGHKWPTPKSEGVYYLICSRLVNLGFKGMMPEPKPDTVIECGNWEPEVETAAEAAA
ncbi:MAG: hypothetical protein EPN91_07280 [Salinibacterium sp.]|nr:MAG: hypothetical protein EPN91_07280 [Salinibacterium sp.]